MIYEGSPSTHLSGLASLMMVKLKANTRCLYLNSPAMVAGIRSYLAAAGLDVEQEIAKGRLLLSSDQSHLTNGSFEVDKMLGMLKDALDQALNDGYKALWATGDMTWEFGNENNLVKLLEYECGLEELFRKHPALCGICQYHKDTLPIDVIKQALYTHEAVYINETLSTINPYYALHESRDHQLQNVSTSQLEDMLNRLHQPADSADFDTIEPR